MKNRKSELKGGSTNFLSRISAKKFNRAGSSYFSPLSSNIEKAKEQKQRLKDFVLNLNEQYKQGNLTYLEYENKLNRALKHKSPEYWLNYYDDYIKRLEEKSKQIFSRERQIINPKSFFIILTIAIISLIALAVFINPSIRHAITGFVTETLGEPTPVEPTIPENISNETTLEIPINETPINITPETPEIPAIINETEPIEIPPQITSNKKDFRIDENAEFRFEYIKNGRKIKEEKMLNNFATASESLNVFLYNSKGEALEIQPEIIKDAEGSFKISLAKTRVLKAGKYTLKLVFTRNGKTSEIEQDFTWGVLAINTHKSIYLPNEESFIAMAVLDDEGHVVCDADVTLEITAPDNSIEVLSTQNGKISISDECSYLGVTKMPDYYGYYNVKGTGNYSLNLTAITKNGIRSIYDTIIVQDSVPFDVVRQGATRIYPLAIYSMNFTIKANQNYQGIVTEKVPSVFKITPKEGMQVTEQGLEKTISWQVDFMQGNTYELSYEFDAPDVSPFLFLAGSLQIDSWQEARQWQIASDQVKFTSRGVGDIALTVLSNTSYVIAIVNETRSYTIGNNTMFAVMNTTGATITAPIEIGTTVGWMSRIDVDTINSTAFVLGWADQELRDDMKVVYSSTGTPLFTASNSDGDIGAQYYDVCIAALDAGFGYGFMDYDTTEGSDADVRAFNYAGTIIGSESTLDGSTSCAVNQNQLMDCAAVNGSLFAVFYNDCTSSDVTYGTYRLVSGTFAAVTGATDMDTVAAGAQVAVTSLNKNRYVLVAYDGTEQDVQFAIKNITDNTFIIGGADAMVDVDSDVGAATMSRIAVAPINNGSEDDYWAVAWYDSIDNNISVKIYNAAGVQQGAWTVATDVKNEPQTRTMDMAGKKPNGLSLCSGKFIIAYVNSSNNTIVKGYDINGSEWDGTCEKPLVPTLGSASLTLPAGNINVNKSETFIVNATVTCSVAACGQVNGTLRYNASNGNPNVKINAITPLNTSYANPQVCSGALGVGQSCTVQWIVNSNATIGSQYMIDVYFNSTAAGAIETETSDVKITTIADDVVFNSSFQQGNLVNWTYTGGNATWRYYNATVNYTTQYFADKHWWFFYSVENLTGKNVQVNITNILEIDDTGDRWANIEPVYSYDNETWFRIPLANRSFNSAQNVFSVTITTNGSNKIFVAPIPPYPPWRVNNLKAEFSTSPFLNTSNLVTTPLLGLETPKLTITNWSYNESQKYRIYVICQQHAGETIASWVCEGMIRFLLNETNATAAQLRRDYVWVFVPVFNIEGTYTGTSRYTPVRFNNQSDFNMAWDDADIDNLTNREVNATFYDIKRFNPHLFTDVHTSVNNESTSLTHLDKYFLYGNLNSNMSDFMTVQGNYWKNTTLGSVGNSQSSAVGVYSRLGIQISTMIEHPHDNISNAKGEGDHNPQNITDWKQWGENFVLGTLAYFKTVNASLIDSDGPIISNAKANETTIALNKWFCVNATVSDVSGVSTVYANIWNTTAFINLTMTDTGSTSCDVAGGDGIYGVDIQGTKTGYWNYTRVYANDTLDNWATYSITNNITINVTPVSNTAPVIEHVSAIPATSPIEASARAVIFSFTAYDAQGTSDLNPSSIKVNLSVQYGNVSRYNTTCVDVGAIDSYRENFSCAVDLWYWEPDTKWNVTINISDNSALEATNRSTYFDYTTLTALKIGPSSISFSGATPGSSNITGSSAILVNNTGNDNTRTISINASNLWNSSALATSKSNYIAAENFTVDIETGGYAECDINGGATRLINSSYVNVTGALLPRGNNTNNEGQRRLYYCLNNVSSSLPSGTYDTTLKGPWWIKILLVAVVPAETLRRLRKKKGRKKEEKELSKQTLLEVFDEKLKEEYGVGIEQIVDSVKREKQTRELQEIEIPISIFEQGKLGPLEMLVKYLKENAGLRIVEIAELLARDHRTIWFTYSNASKKMKTRIAETKARITVSVSVLSNRKLSLLEAVVMHLIERGMRKSEIAELLGRDIRIIYTIYSRAKNKLER